MTADHAEDSPPPNRIYAARHADAIRFLARSGMSRRHIEAIYGKQAVALILGPLETKITETPPHSAAG